MHPADGPQTRRKFNLIAIAVIAYPFVAHFSLLYGQRYIGVSYACVLGAAALWSMRRRGLMVQLALAGLVAVVVAAVATSQAHHLVYFPPIAVTALLAWLFGRTLARGRTPLVSTFAAMIRGELDPRVAAYTRGVTLGWTVVLVLMTLQLGLLAAFAPIELWSLFANGVNYLIVAVLFLAEYVFRRIYLSDVPHAGFLHYLKSLRRIRMSSAVERPGHDG